MKKYRIILSLFSTAILCAVFAALMGEPALGFVSAILFLGCLAVSFGMQTSAMALTICGSISACVKPDCNNPLTGGLEVEFYLANKADVDSLSTTFTASNPLIITAWVMSTPKFYTYEGIKSSNTQKQGIIKGKYITNFDHELTFLVSNVSAAAKAQLEGLARGLVVAIVKNNYKGALGASRYEVLGLGQGLELSALERDSSNADSQGGYILTIKTPAGYSEPHLPANIFNTDAATTDAIVTGLLATCS